MDIPVMRQYHTPTKPTRLINTLPAQGRPHLPRSLPNKTSLPSLPSSLPPRRSVPRRTPPQTRLLRLSLGNPHNAPKSPITQLRLRYHKWRIPRQLRPREPKPGLQLFISRASFCEPSIERLALIGMAIGKVTDAQFESIRTLLQGVQLPITDAWSPQNCVDWIKAAVRKLRMFGYAGKVDDLDRIMARALAHADLRMADPANAPSKLDILGNEM